MGPQPDTLFRDADFLLPSLSIISRGGILRTRRQRRIPQVLSWQQAARRVTARRAAPGSSVRGATPHHITPTSATARQDKAIILK